MPKSRSKRAVCPYCGRQFDSRGYDNHVTSCKKAHAKPRKATEKT